MTTFTDSKNPADDFTVEPNPKGKGYIIGVKSYCECGRACCSRPQIGTRPHTRGDVFDDPDDAADWIESMRDRFEEQYDEYLQENHYAIAQQERCEAFLAER